MTRIYADVLRCKRHVYRYMPRRFSGTIIEGEIEGIEAQMVREWKKKFDFSRSMAADGRKRIRTFCSFNETKIFDDNISAFHFV